MHMNPFSTRMINDVSYRIMNVSMLTPRFEPNEPRKCPYQLKCGQMYEKQMHDAVFWFDLKTAQN